MANVMVVDDVRDYCDELAAGLRRDGHHVTTVYDGLGAIERGRTEHPQILVTDWMLQDHLNGLDVFDALKVVCPMVEAVIMTGYASHDLRSDAQLADTCDFLEKPFGIEEVRRAVNLASKRRRWWHFPRPIGFLHSDRNGEIIFANARAEDMLDSTGPGAFATSLTECFGPEQAERMSKLSSTWAEVSPLAEDSLIWHVSGANCAQTGDRVYILLDEADEALRESRVVRHLLGLRDVPPKRPTPQRGHILIVDDFESVRRVAGEVLRELGAVVLSAADLAEAMRLFIHDSEITTVLLDYQLPGTNPEKFVRFARALRPETIIIGTSASNSAEDFRDMGVVNFLPKPWLVDELVSAIRRASPVTN